MIQIFESWAHHLSQEQFEIYAKVRGAQYRGLHVMSIHPMCVLMAVSCLAALCAPHLSTSKGEVPACASGVLRQRRELILDLSAGHGG